jgi:hypothetical protein
MVAKWVSGCDLLRRHGQRRNGKGKECIRLGRTGPILGAAQFKYSLVLWFLNIDKARCRVLPRESTTASCTRMVAPSSKDVRVVAQRVATGRIADLPQLRET